MSKQVPARSRREEIITWVAQAAGATSGTSSIDNDPLAGQGEELFIKPKMLDLTAKSLAQSEILPWIDAKDCADIKATIFN